jgi:uncharacterized protein (DUF488 family)
MTDRSNQSICAISTIGHSNRPFDHFTDLLAAHSVELVVDVRAFPGSRRLPHYGRESLEANLPPVDIGYLHLGALGGRRKPDPSLEVPTCCDGWRHASFRAYAQYTQSEQYASALDELVALARMQRTVIMCAEAVPWRCHRWLISDTLVAREVPVHHIIDQGPLRQHVMSPFAKVEHHRVTWPGPPSADALRLGPALPARTTRKHERSI